MNNHDEIFQQAIDKWGRSLQLVMVVEECAELQQEVTKILRGNPPSQNIAGEIADVKLCVANLEYMLGLKESVALMEEHKILRLIHRLQEPAPLASKGGENA